mgnify:CR=1 FL=1
MYNIISVYIHSKKYIGKYTWKFRYFLPQWTRFFCISVYLRFFFKSSEFIITEVLAINKSIDNTLRKYSRPVYCQRPKEKKRRAEGQHERELITKGLDDVTPSLAKIKYNKPEELTHEQRIQLFQACVAAWVVAICSSSDTPNCVMKRFTVRDFLNKEFVNGGYLISVQKHLTKTPRCEETTQFGFSMPHIELFTLYFRLVSSTFWGNF